MDDRNYNSTIRLWRGEKSAKLGDLNSRLDMAKRGEMLGNFTAYGRHDALRLTVIGYPIDGARFGAYALIKATTNPEDQALRIDVYPGEEYTDQALRLGAFVLEPEGSPRPSRLGSQHLRPASGAF